MSDLSQRTLTIKRTFNAPLSLVWQAWTDPDHIAKWWAPEGMGFQVVHHEFKEGGEWKYNMIMPNGNAFIAEGKYLEIIPKQKIVTSSNFLPMTKNVELHCLFKSVGDNTEFVFNAVHESAEYCKQQEEMGFYNGWGSAFDRLETTF